MSYTAKVLEDSISPKGHRLTTLEVTAPRFILAEVNTHRMISKSSASSRAVPVLKNVERVEQNSFFPLAWAKNQAGMQSAAELGADDASEAHSIWSQARDFAVFSAKKMAEVGVHKQYANRLTEPFAFHTMILSGTEWSNMHALRDHADAQPEFKKVQQQIKAAMAASSPTPLEVGTWHLPLVRRVDFSDIITDYQEGRLSRMLPLDVTLAFISAGRCARVSYLTHEGKRDPQADFDLGYRRLVPNGHCTPTEHCARVMDEQEYKSVEQIVLEPGAGPIHQYELFDQGKRSHFLGNYQGFVQLRKLIRHENDYGELLKSRL